MKALLRQASILICLTSVATALTLDEADEILDKEEAEEAKNKPAVQAEPKPTEEPVAEEAAPEPPAVDQESLQDIVPSVGEVRESLDKAVKYLDEISVKDADRWLLPPVRQRKVVDYEEKQVTYRYSLKTVEVPIWEYETVTRMVQRKKGTSVNAVTVLEEQKIRRNTGKQIGTKKVERHVRDPNGTKTITHTHRKPIYGEGGPDRWRLYQMGCNAMGAYAALKATDDQYNEVARSIADNLHSIILDFGLPDTTWDLAWITALFSEMESKHFKEMAKKSASKLLDGQLDKGTPAGMWGPVCLNRKVLAESIKIQTKLGEELLAASAKLKAAEKVSLTKGGMKADREASEADAAHIKAKDAMMDFARELGLVTMMGTATLHIDSRVILKNDVAAPLDLMGLPEYIYNQTSADTESTALAVFALTTAAKNGCIPPKTIHPKDSTGKPFVPEVRASDILKRTLAVIRKAQHQNGAFAENNFALPVTDFNGSPIPGMPVKANTFKPLPMPINLASCVYGMDTLMNTARAFGPKTGAQLIPNFNAAYGYVKQNSSEEQQKKDDNGFLVPPYDYYFWFFDAVRGSEVPELSEITDDLLKKVVRTQGDDGSWKSGTKTPWVLPSSHRARMKTYPVRFGTGQRDFDLSQAYVPFAADTRKRVDIARYGFDDAVMSTAYSVLMLSDYLEEAEKHEAAVE
jgi:hypothetical protein